MHAYQIRDKQYKKLIPTETMAGSSDMSEDEKLLHAWREVSDEAIQYLIDNPDSEYYVPFSNINDCSIKSPKDHKERARVKAIRKRVLELRKENK